MYQIASWKDNFYLFLQTPKSATDNFENVDANTLKTSKNEGKVIA